MQPGAMALTFTPRPAHSLVRALVSPAMPDLAATKPGTVTPPRKLSIDAVKITRAVGRRRVVRPTGGYASTLVKEGAGAECER
nr:hypothetical protein GCM10020063_054200 [Dactylosporangium thailandense]